MKIFRRTFLHSAAMFWLRRVILITAVLHPYAVRAVEYSFGFPEPLGPPASLPDRREFGGSLSHNLLSLYYNLGSGTEDIWLATRPSVSEPWSSPSRLPEPISLSAHLDSSPRISADDLVLIFVSNRPGSAERDLWMSTRPDPQSPWESATNLAAVNSVLSEEQPELSTNGLELYFVRDLSDIYVSTRTSLVDEWGAPQKLGPNVNFENARSIAPVLTDDGLTMFFSSDVGMSEFSTDIYLASRPDWNSPWGVAVALDSAINTNGVEWATDVASDGYLYFTRGNSPSAQSSLDLYRVAITPIPEPASLFVASACFSLIALVRRHRELAYHQPATKNRT